jgi:hypothetical protein
MAATRTRKPRDPAPLDWQAALAAARQALVARRELRDADVGKLGVPKALRAKLLDELAGPGVERTPKGVRLRWWTSSEPRSRSGGASPSARSSRR